MSEYTGKEIVVLEGLEAVRKRPGMYIGSTGSRGLHHLIWEILDNSIDEHLAGFCNEINITVQKDGGICVEDNGRGVPIDIHPTKKIPTVRVVYTILHAGGKFGNGAYKVSGGLHGVGSSVVNALSTHMIVEIKKMGWYIMMSIKMVESLLLHLKTACSRRWENVPKVLLVPK